MKMKKVLLSLFVCLSIQAFCLDPGGLQAQSVYPDTLSWSWEVSSTTSTHTKSCIIAFTDNLLVNWGDGVTEWIPDSMSSQAITHVYAAQANYSCSAIGVGISYFKAESKRLLSLETSKAPDLTYISCSSNQITSLDLEKNLYLISLYCSGNDLTALNLGNNLQLQTLTCSDNKLVTLDISRLPLLKKVTTHTNLLTKIKVNPIGALNYLSCTNCNLSANALDSIFIYLPTLSEISTSKNLYVLNNPGSSSCRSEIAAAKNWTIDRVITQSSFYIPSVSCRMNDSVEVSLFLKTVAPAVAFEVDIQIPDGFMLDTARTCLDFRRKKQHVLSFAKISTTPTVYKFMAYSLKSKDTFSETDGVILHMYLKAPSIMITYTLEIQNAILIDTLTNVMDISVNDGSITVTAAALMGDANGDNNVNVTDIAFLVAWINGKNPSGFFSDAADMDGNGIWNIADITKLVDLINSQGTSGGSSSAPPKLKASDRIPSFYNPVTASIGNHMYLSQSVKYPLSLELCMANNISVQAFQVDIILPDNVGFKMGSIGKTFRSKNHVFSLEKILEMENRWRLISYSLKPNELYADTVGPLAVLPIEYYDKIQAGTYNVFLDGQVYTGSDLKDVVGSIYDTQLTIVKPVDTVTEFEIYSEKGKLNVVGNSLLSISVRDLLGRSVAKIESPNLFMNQIQLSPGIYLVSVLLSDGNTSTKKVIVP